MAADLDTAFALAKNDVDEAEAAIQSYDQQRFAKDRSYIANIVVVAFVLLIAAITAGVFLQDWSTWEKPAEFLLKMLNSVLLPVVTLVIGYYFGKEKR